MLVNMVLFSGLIVVFAVLYEPSPVTILDHIGLILLIALFPAVMFTILRSLFKAIVPVLFLVLLFVTSALILTGAVFLHHPDGGMPFSDPVLQRYLPTGVILSGGDVSVRIDDTTGVILSDVLLVYHRHIPSIQVIPEAMWDAEKSQIVLPNGTEIESENFSEVLWWRIPPAIRNIAADSKNLFMILAEPLFSGRLVHAVMVWSAFLLALLAVWTPARLFRWPLLNLVISLAYLRAVLALPDWLQSLIELFSLPDWIPGVLSDYPVVPGWALSALVLLIIAVFLPPLDRWQREMMEEEGGK